MDCSDSKSPMDTQARRATERADVYDGPDRIARSRRNLPWRVRVPLTVLAALLPLSLALDGYAEAVAPTILFLVGLYFLAAHATVRLAYRRAWPVMACAVLIIAWAIANTLAHGLGASALDGAAHILLYLVIAAVFAARLDTRILWAGFSLTAIGFGMACIVQHFGQGIDRAYSLDGGASTSIEFATLMLGLALTSLVQLLRVRMGWAGRCLHGAALLLGAYGGLLTQSRGPLVAFALALIGLLALKSILSRRWRWCLGGVAAFVVAAAIGMTSLHGATLKRFTAIDQQIAVANTGQVDGSVSARVGMWRTAIRALSERPLVGVGIGRFKAYMDAEIAAGRTDPAVARYNNPHDMYLGAAAAGGMPGLLVLLAMFLVPLGFFARGVIAGRGTTSAADWAGLAIVVLYMLCAVTDSVFYRIMTQSFYYMLVLGLAVLAAHERAANESRSIG